MNFTDSLVTSQTRKSGKPPHAAFGALDQVN